MPVKQDLTIVICGPTASGKSALALALAEQVDGAVINADSMQLYSSLRVITARPSAEEEARAPHSLYGVLDANDPASAGRWRDMALAAIAQARADGHWPILVGGTGLYLSALLDGLAPIPPIPAPIRAEGEKRLAEDGVAALHAALDPESAAAIRPSDPHRVLRAWVVMAATGRSIIDWRREDGPPALQDKTCVVTLAPPRPALHAAIAARCAAMARAGAADEAAAFFADHARAAETPLGKAVGLRAFADLAAGRMDEAAAIEAATIETRQYAKRQQTWFRRRPAADIMLNKQFSTSEAEKIVIKIQNEWLT